MLVRDTPGGAGRPLEVLMVRRNLQSDFVGGVYIFPGGALDAADAGADALARCAGRTEADARAILGLGSGALAYWVAVLRESFEEAGVLLAYGPDGELLSFADPEIRARLEEHRRALNAGEREFIDVCGQEGLVLATDRVHYFAHWITPEGAPRRYDTRFFVALAPPGQEPTHDDRELIDTVWLSPDEALRRHRQGGFELILPTIANLRAIARFPDTAELLAAAALASDASPVMEPHIVLEGPRPAHRPPGGPRRRRGRPDGPHGPGGLAPGDLDDATGRGGRR